MDIGHPKYDPSLKEQSPLELPHWFSSKKEKKAAPPQPASTPKPVATAPDPTPTTPPKEQPAPPAKQEYFWPAYVAGIIAIAVIVFFGVRAASSLFDVWTDLEPTAKLADSTASTDSTDTAATDATTVADTTATETPADTAAAPEETPAATPAPAAVIDPASLTVRVLNGNGVPGAAQKAADVLAAANIPVASTANAKKFSYSATMVYYPTGKKDEATLVANALSASYSTQLEENAVADGYDALVVVGAQ